MLCSYVLRDSRPDSVLSLFLIFYQNQGFCSDKKSVEDFEKISSFLEPHIYKLVGP